MRRNREELVVWYVTTKREFEEEIAHLLSDNEVKIRKEAEFINSARELPPITFVKGVRVTFNFPLCRARQFSSRFIDTKFLTENAFRKEMTDIELEMDHLDADEELKEELKQVSFEVKRT